MNFHKMIVSAIVAIARNRVIGKDNQIPWYLPADLKYFKRTTLHHHVIMGRKTFESIGRPLPKRTNIVITRNPFWTTSNVLIANSVQEALAIAAENGEEECFIIGGGQIYELSMDFLDRIYLTEVDLETDGEIGFPPLDPDSWKLTSSQAHPPDEKNEWGYTFKIFEKQII